MPVSVTTIGSINLTYELIPPATKKAEPTATLEISSTTKVVENAWTREEALAWEQEKGTRNHTNRTDASLKNSEVEALKALNALLVKLGVDEKDLLTEIPASTKLDVKALAKSPIENKKAFDGAVYDFKKVAATNHIPHKVKGGVDLSVDYGLHGKTTVYIYNIEDLTDKQKTELAKTVNNFLGQEIVSPDDLKTNYSGRIEPRAYWPSISNLRTALASSPELKDFAFISHGGPQLPKPSLDIVVTDENVIVSIINLAELGPGQRKTFANELNKLLDRKDIKADNLEEGYSGKVTPRTTIKIEDLKNNFKNTPGTVVMPVNVIDSRSKQAAPAAKPGSVTVEKSNWWQKALDAIGLGSKVKDMNPPDKDKEK